MSWIMEHTADGISHLATKEANKLLIKSIQETAETKKSAAYNMADFLGLNSCQNSVAYSREAFNIANTGIPNRWLMLNSQSTVHLMCNPELVSNVQ